MTQASQKTPTRWAREYETIYILRPNVLSDDAEKVAQRVQDVLDRLGGKLTQVDSWGRRQLAYKIDKQSRGIFVYIKYVAFNDAVAELERNLRLMDEVMRYQTVLLVDRIDPSTVEVDAEAVKFEAIEEDAEPYEEEDLATRLGMARPEEPARADEAEGEAASAEGEAASAEGETASAEGEAASAETASAEGEAASDANSNTDGEEA